MKRKFYDIVVVGAGVAGMTAALYAKRANKTVLVLEEKMQGGQIVSTVSIANWPGEPGISGRELSEKIYHQANESGVEFEYDKVIAVGQGGEFLSVNDAAEETRKVFIVKTESEEYSCGAIIIATGTEPRKLSEKQTKEAGKRQISYCAICDGAFYKDKPVVVIGSGNTAKHEIKYLSNIASKVYHIHHDDPIPEDAVGIFVAIGRVPNTEVFDGFVELDDDGYVKAGEDCETSRPGVFVAGDCRTKYVRQLVTAAGDGAVAASAAVRYLG